MKKSSHTFVRFLNLFRALNNNYADKGVSTIHQEAVAILAYVSEEHSNGRCTTITKVVQQIEFGTPPTIQRRLKELVALEFIVLCKGDDKRHRLLKVTEQGDAYLRDCSKLLGDVVRPCSCDCSC